MGVLRDKAFSSACNIEGGFDAMESDGTYPCFLLFCPWPRFNKCYISNLGVGLDSEEEPVGEEDSFVGRVSSDWLSNTSATGYKVPCSIM